jgi:DNA-3-methyladenine glycosylase II
MTPAWRRAEGRGRREIAPLVLGRESLLHATHRLARSDRRIGALVRRYGPPPLWARPRGFPTLLRIILEQQVSLASARAMYLRLLAQLPAVTPATVLDLGTGRLRQIGFTRQKAGYAVALAGWVEDGRLPLARLHRHSDTDAYARLTAVPGIGPWTAAIYLLMALRRPDVWPPGDLALHKAMGRLAGVTRVPSAAQAEAMAERWRPFRAVAARILWHAYLSERGV